MQKISKYAIAVLAVLLGAFFIYKGINKHWLSPCKVYGQESTIPLAYQQVITAFCQSGFLKMVGLFQAAAGILLLIPKTRLLGAVILLPVIFNIFFIHAFLDNRPIELVETGIPLLITLIIIAIDFNKVRKAFL